jgi:hypothetical protein
MGVGHAAIALGATKVVPRVNVGWLVFAALLSDLLLGVFALMGLEHASVPPDYALRHYLWFTFPYSHGLLPLVLWAAIAGFLASQLQRSNGRRVAIVVAVVVLSHFVLDALVHISGLPLAGEHSPKIGLGLWNHMPLELSLETLMAVVGVVIYLRVAGSGASPVSRYGIPGLLVFLTAMTWTQLFSDEPPRPDQLVFFWIGSPLVLSGVAYLLDRGRSSRPANAS